MDNNLILLLSTVFDGHEPVVIRIRRRPATTSSNTAITRIPYDGKPTAELPIPRIINEYNHGMGSIDIGDQL